MVLRRERNGRIVKSGVAGVLGNGGVDGLTGNGILDAKVARAIFDVSDHYAVLGKIRRSRSNKVK